MTGGYAVYLSVERCELQDSTFAPSVGFFELREGVYKTIKVLQHTRGAFNSKMLGESENEASEFTHRYIMTISLSFCFVRPITWHVGKRVLRVIECCSIVGISPCCTHDHGCPFFYRNGLGSYELAS